FIGAMQGVVGRMATRDRWVELGRILDDYTLEITDSVKSTDGKPLRFKVTEYSTFRHLCVALEFVSTTPDSATQTRDPTDPLHLITPPIEGDHTHAGGGHGGHTGGDGSHTHAAGPHVHHVLTPVPLDSILPGDWVEVHWLTNYSDPIVAGAIVTGKS